MNEIIAYGIAEKLVAGGIISRATGCAKVTPVKNGFDMTNPVVYIATGQGQTVCNIDAKLFSFLPNDAEKAIAYFQDNGSTITKLGSNFERYLGSVKLFVWINTKLIDPANAVGIKRKIVDALDDKITAEGQILSGRFDAVKIHGSDEKPYAKCKLDEKNKQYLTSPYDYLVVDLIINIVTVKGCLQTLEINPATC